MGCWQPIAHGMVFKVSDLKGYGSIYQHPTAVNLCMQFFIIIQTIKVTVLPFRVTLWADMGCGRTT